MLQGKMNPITGERLISRQSIQELIKKHRKILEEQRKQAVEDNRLSEGELKNLIFSGAQRYRDSSGDKTSVRLWSPELRDEFLALPQLAGDRAATKINIERLRAKVAGCRLPFTWAVVHCKEDGATYRVNGNRSAHLSKAYPELFEGAQIAFTEFRARTQEEVNLIFVQYDSKDSTRTVAVSLNPYVVSFGIGMPLSKVTTIISGADMALNGIDALGDRGIDLRFEMLYQTAPFLYWMEDKFPVSTINRMFFRRPVCAFMFMLYDMLTDAEREVYLLPFLTKVMLPQVSSYGKGDPCLLFQSKIRDVKGPSSNDWWSYVEHFIWGVLAWNAFVRSESLTVFRIYGNKLITKVEMMPPNLRKKYKVLKVVTPEVANRK
jgi:hypothetical protein